MASSSCESCAPVRLGSRARPRLARLSSLDQASAGVLATVFLDRVEWLAFEAGADIALLLGRVAAHELGHLLMRALGMPPVA